MNFNRLKLNVCHLAACSTFLLCSITDAAPAPWFRWQSITTGEMVCTQVPMGKGWKMLNGPFKDSQCRVKVDLHS